MVVTATRRVGQRQLHRPERRVPLRREQGDVVPVSGAPDEQREDVVAHALGAGRPSRRPRRWVRGDLGEVVASLGRVDAGPFDDPVGVEQQEVAVGHPVLSLRVGRARRERAGGPPEVAGPGGGDQQRGRVPRGAEADHARGRVQHGDADGRGVRVVELAGEAVQRGDDAGRRPRPTPGSDGRPPAAAPSPPKRRSRAPRRPRRRGRPIRRIARRCRTSRRPPPCRPRPAGSAPLPRPAAGSARPRAATRPAARRGPDRARARRLRSRGGGPRRGHALASRPLPPGGIGRRVGVALGGGVPTSERAKRPGRIPEEAALLAARVRVVAGLSDRWGAGRARALLACGCEEP